MKKEHSPILIRIIRTSVSDQPSRLWNSPIGVRFLPKDAKVVHVGNNLPSKHVPLPSVEVWASHAITRTSLLRIPNAQMQFAA